jgi:hypothetical protein
MTRKSLISRNFVEAVCVDSYGVARPFRTVPPHPGPIASWSARTTPKGVEAKEAIWRDDGAGRTVVLQCGNNISSRPGSTSSATVMLQWL